MACHEPAPGLLQRGNVDGTLQFDDRLEAHRRRPVEKGHRPVGCADQVVTGSFGIGPSY